MIKLRFSKKRLLFLTCLLVALSFSLSACGGNSGGSDSGETETLVFADAGWESIRFHNNVAKVIIEEGMGYSTDVMPGSTPATFQGLVNGDIDLYMETWQENIDTYDEAVESGDILELAVNFDDNAQGLFVPTYVIEGDSERGIEPMAPDLHSVLDLPKYVELFPDEEDKDKGRIYGSIPGWAADEMLKERVKEYKLDETFNYFSPGSDAALATSIVDAYEKGEGWVGYYWVPTWISGKYDLTLLEEPNPFPAMDVTVTVNKDVQEKAPDVVEFLKHYETSADITSEALAYMEDNDASEAEAASWFLKEKKELWTEWVSEEIAEKVIASLDE